METAGNSVLTDVESVNGVDPMQSGLQDTDRYMAGRLGQNRIGQDRNGRNRIGQEIQAQDEIDQERICRERQAQERIGRERQAHHRIGHDRLIQERQHAPYRTTSERPERSFYPERPIRRQVSELAPRSKARLDLIYQRYDYDYEEPPKLIRSNADSIAVNNMNNKNRGFVHPDTALGFNSEVQDPRAVDYYVNYTCGNNTTSLDNAKMLRSHYKNPTVLTDDISSLPRQRSSRRKPAPDPINPVLPQIPPPKEEVLISHTSSTGNVNQVTDTKHPPLVVESVAEFTGNITASFIRIIFEEGCSAPRRFIWFVMWVACCSYAISNMNAAFTQYFLYDTSSQLSFTQQTNGNLPLPAITICNMNKFRESWLSVEENSVLMKYEEERVWGEHMTNITEEDNEKAKRITVDELEADGRHSIEDMFREVLFAEEDLKEGEWGRHFKNTSTELGICFTFNWDNSKRVKRTGADYGASFKININQSEYAKTTESAGIKVMLHEYREPPLIKEYGLAIPPGSEAYISTRALKLKNLGAPYLNSNCTNKTLQTDDFYTTARCNLECQSQILFEECNCTQSHHPRLGSQSRVCSLFDHKMCTEAIMRRIHHGDFSDRFSRCGCIDACSSTSYSSSLSRAEFPSLATARELTNLPDSPYSDISSLRENFIWLHVYFETLSVETVEKVASYSTQNLLGDVGGNLGLFIGASVATLAEILDYVARLVYVWVKT